MLFFGNRAVLGSLSGVALARASRPRTPWLYGPNDGADNIQGFTCEVVKLLHTLARPCNQAGLERNLADQEAAQWQWR